MKTDEIPADQLESEMLKTAEEPVRRAMPIPLLRYAWLVGVALLVVAPLLASAFTVVVLTEILIFGLFVASLTLLVGVTGLPSLGHAAYYGMGAYSSALWVLHVSDNAVLSVIVGLVAGAVAAIATGWLAVRMRGVYFLILTVAITEIGFSLAGSWTAVTGGTNGMVVSDQTILPGVVMSLDGYVYWFVLVLVGIAYALLRSVTRSPFGRALVGVRENEERMRALGYRTFWYKFAVYSVAGAFAGMAGALSVVSTGFVSQEDASFTTAALAFIAVIVGGSRSLFGGFLGAAVVIVVRDELSTVLPGHSTLVLGVIFVIVVYLLPKGFAGGWEQARAVLGRRFGRGERA